MDSGRTPCHFDRSDARHCSAEKSVFERKGSSGCGPDFSTPLRFGRNDMRMPGAFFSISFDVSATTGPANLQGSCRRSFNSTNSRSTSKGWEKEIGMTTRRLSARKAVLVTVFIAVIGAYVLLILQTLVSPLGIPTATEVSDNKDDIPTCCTRRPSHTAQSPGQTRKWHDAVSRLSPPRRLRTGTSCRPAGLQWDRESRRRHGPPDGPLPHGLHGA